MKFASQNLRNASQIATCEAVCTLTDITMLQDCYHTKIQTEPAGKIFTFSGILNLALSTEKLMLTRKKNPI